MPARGGERPAVTDRAQARGASPIDDPPRASLVEALRRMGRGGAGARRLAIDLGCGAGQDSLALLRRGWTVVAIDASARAGEAVRAAVEPRHAARFRFVRARFEAAALPAGAALVNASFSLPFCAREHFPRVWAGIEAALAPDGWFAGHFFGMRDEWVREGACLGWTAEEIARLFARFEVVWRREEVERAPSIHGPVKRWHIVAVVARKRAPGGGRFG
ncbi:Methyltransferase type 11 [Methylobacterium sp. 4-46]|nr:Methyltransferase type 11 [Methylobacterium sp. 4-46]